ncbi:unnamed protein product [Bursaphelenchus okinawaensis]|uniref:Uncharacterized protein n=1 Tax=Bursaphelenchus okinawaensis TaxID=465554 RepID=A0A811LU78_9BILA|nr:unnamed protein product [Bursaphelenchus okinawaensis]CAG9127845.1 unnamed protein product [Bursaphelenchus okinawaensis]
MTLSFAVTSRSSIAKSVESENTEHQVFTRIPPFSITKGKVYVKWKPKTRQTLSVDVNNDRTQLKVMRSRAQSRQRDHTPSRDERIQWLQEARAAYSVGPTARSRAKSQSPARSKLGTTTPQKRQNMFQRSSFDDDYDQSDVNAEFLNLDLKQVE